MEQNILDLSFDNSKFNTSQKQILTGLNEIIAAAEKIENTKINVGGDASFALLNQKLLEQQKQIEALKTANVEYVKSQMVVTDATKATTTAVIASNSELETNLALRAKLQAQNKSWAIDQKEDLDLLKKGIITRAEYNQRITESSKNIEANKVKVGDLSKVIKQQTQDSVGSIDATKRKIAASQQEQKINNALTNEYKQLSLASADASLRFKNYALTLGANHPVTLQAKADALALRTQLVTLDTAVGESGKNVGNYANSVGKAAGSVYGVIRKAANILPGLGISGIFLAIFEGLKYASEALGFFNTKLSDTVKNYQNLVEVQKKANEGAAKELVTSKLLYEAATDRALSMKERIAAGNELIKQYPFIFEGQTAENIVNGQAVTQYNALTAAIMENAKSKAVLAKLEELEAQRLDVADRKRRINNATTNEANRVKGVSTDVVFGGGTLGGAGTGGVTLSEADQKRRIEARRLEALKVQDAIVKSIDEQEKFLTDYAGKKNLEKAVIPTGGNADKAVKAVEDLTNELLKAEADRLKALSEMNKLELELQAKAMKSIVDNEKEDYAMRLIALQEYTNIKTAIAKNQSDLETKELKNKLEEIVSIEAIAVDKRTSEQKKLLIQKQALLAQAKLAEFKYSIEVESINLDQINKVRELRIKETEDLRKEEEKRVKDNAEALKQRYEAEKRTIEDIGNFRKINSVSIELNGLKALNEAYKLGEVSYEEYTKAKVQLSTDAATAVLKSDLQTAEALYNSAVKNGGDIVATLAKYKAAELAVLKNSGKEQEDTDKEITGKRKKVIDDIVSYEDQAAKLIQGLHNAAYVAELNRIQDLKDAQDQYYAKQQENITNSTLSEQQKANQLAVLKNQQETSDRAFDKRRRDAQNKEAEFQKKLALFQIALHTAMAVIAALTSVPPNVPLSIAVGVAGAVELAVAAATPVPHYKHGTPPGGHKGGIARWAEDDVPEEVIRPDKPAYIAYNDTTGYLPAGTIVKPLTKDYVNSKARDGATRLTGRMGERRAERNEAWDIAKWQSRETRKAVLEMTKRPIKNTLVVRESLNVSKVFGRL